ncbi:ImuA family protein [Paenirhodobacter sp.]|uniref:ImuA family protein n=1 Tax=Paenirhodobacter sp. TaxID=1965326 RepID=UPI003B3CE076
MSPTPNLPTLLPGRVHEACGPGRVAFALAQLGQGGDALWGRVRGVGDALCPDGMAEFCCPTDLLLTEAATEVDSLAVAEEALRDGCLALVVVEITKPLTLREGRRLQLAAKAGGTTGLCLIPEGMGSNAAETRWHCAPVFADSTLMRWEIIKNKSGTMGVWHVRWNRTAHRVDVVSPVRGGPGSAAVAGDGAFRAEPAAGQRGQPL